MIASLPSVSQAVGEDMDKMQELIDEMEKLNSKAVDLDVQVSRG